MLKVTMKLDEIISVEYMYEKEFELWKLTNKFWEVISIVSVERAGD